MYTLNPDAEDHELNFKGEVEPKIDYNDDHETGCLGIKPAERDELLSSLPLRKAQVAKSGLYVSKMQGSEKVVFTPQKPRTVSSVFERNIPRVNQEMDQCTPYRKRLLK